MRKSATVAAVGAALLLTTLPAVAAAEPDPAADVSAATTPTEARGLVVKTRTPDATLLRAVDRATDPDIEVQSPDAVTRDISVVDFDSVVAYDDAAEAAEQVAARPDVEWAIPNGRVQASAASPVTPNDPGFAKQWQLWDAGAKAAGGYSTKAPTVWRTTKGEGSVVAVVDTGILPSHPDLRNQLVPGYDFVGPDRDAEGNEIADAFRGANDGNGRDGDPSDPGDWLLKGEACGGAEPPEKTIDSSWHGSHVAGIIAAQQDNGIGVSGLAPAAKVQPVRALGSCGGWDSDILASIEWASGGSISGVPGNATPADVINLSLGSNYEGFEEYVPLVCEAYGDVMGDALRRGAVSVVAAGNEIGDADASIPSACPNAIGVAATSRAGRGAFYTNKGSTVDIAAYGGDTLVERTAVASTIDAGTRGPAGSIYAEYEGTSMAAPAVSGAAALLMSRGVAAQDVEAALERLVQPFAPPSASALSPATTGPDGRPQRIDLNCRVGTCGAGILDLSRLPTRVKEVDALVGRAVIGEQLSLEWRSLDRADVTWLRDGEPIADAAGPAYVVRREDVGHRLAARVEPVGRGLAAFRDQSVATTVVPDGPSLGVTPLGVLRYGRPLQLGVSAVRPVVQNGRTVDSEPLAAAVELTVGSRRIPTTTRIEGTAPGEGPPYSFAAVSVPGTTLPAGRHVITAAHNGAFGASTFRKTVVVQKATSSVSQSVASSVKRTQRAKLSVTVAVSGITHPTGTVTVYDGRRKIATATLSSSGRGKRTITLPKLSKGTHTIKTVYSGTSNITGTTSSTRTVRSR